MNSRTTRRRVLALTAASLTLAGCVGDEEGDSGSDGTDGGTNSEGSDDGMNGDGTAEDGTDTDDGMGDGGESDDGEDTSDGSDGSNEAMETDFPAWQERELEDVTTGETFTIAAIDEPVVVHTFATYCPICGRQQDEVASGYDELSEQASFVDLTIDENDDPEDLRKHAEENGLDWRFGVSPAEMTGDLVDEFGQSVTVAPQSPLIVVCPDGTAETLSKIAGPDAIRNAIQDIC